LDAATVREEKQHETLATLLTHGLRGFRIRLLGCTVKYTGNYSAKRGQSISELHEIKPRL